MTFSTACRPAIALASLCGSETPLGSSGRQRLGEIFSHRPNLSLLPASNLKLATAAAALLQLGPDYRLTTRVLASRLPAGGELFGDLYLVGGGDPLLYTPEYLATFVRPPAVYTNIKDLAQQVYDRGLRRVNGSIVGVATRYDDRRIASQLMSQESYQYVGPLSALLINDGYVNYAERRDLGNLAIPAADPALFTAAEFDDLLEALDMVITRRPRVAGAEENIRGFIEIARIESAPLSELLLSLLTDSDNTTAELLVKEIASNRAVAEMLAQQPQERQLLPEESDQPEEGEGEASETEQDAQSGIQQGAFQQSRADEFGTLRQRPLCQRPFLQRHPADSNRIRRRAERVHHRFERRPRNIRRPRNSPRPRNNRTAVCPHAKFDYSRRTHRRHWR